MTDIAKIVIRATGLEDVEIHYTGGDRGWAGDVPRTWLDVEKLYSSGFMPKMDSKGAVKRCADSLVSEIGLGKPR